MRTITKATTLEQLRDEIAEMANHYAWQETAFMDRLVKSKKAQQACVHAADALKTLAIHIKAIKIEEA